MTDSNNFQSFAERLGCEFFDRLGLDAHDIESIPMEYRNFAIPKRSGGRRLLSVPCPELLAVQRRLNRTVLRHFPVAEHAMGFTQNRSIALHAAWHAGQKCVIRMDVRNFFADTSWQRIYRYLKSLNWQDTTLSCLFHLCAHPFKRGLPQGAATSPILSNIVNRPLDWLLDSLTCGFHGTYTRYADDLTFSFPYRIHRIDAKLARFKARVRSILSEHGYAIHPAKTAVMGDSTRQVVTGLVVNERPALPRQLRRRLRAADHRARTGKQLVRISGDNRSIPMTEDQVRGWQAFHDMVKRKGSVEESRLNHTCATSWQIRQRANGVISSDTCSDEALATLPDSYGYDWRELTLSHSRITDTGLAALGKLQRLNVLRLDHTAITDGGLLHLLRLKRLEYLDLSHTDITNDGLELIGKIKTLKTLRLRHCGITETGWAPLQRLHRLNELDITGNSGGDAALRVVCQLPALEDLKAPRTELTHVGVEALRHHGTLRVLQVSHNPIQDSGVAPLPSIRQLTTLDLSHTLITDCAIDDLLSCKALTTLNVVGTNISMQGCNRLDRQSPPSCNINHELRALAEDLEASAEEAKQRYEEYGWQEEEWGRQFLEDDDIPF